MDAELWVVNKAREGRYVGVAGVSEDLLKKYFDASADYWQVKDVIGACR